MFITRSKCSKMHAPSALLSRSLPHATVFGVLCLIGTLLPLLSEAQQRSQSGILWPQTFVGQPDFEFTRKEVIEEIKQRNPNTADKLIASYNDLLTARDIDPFRPVNSSGILEAYSRYSSPQTISVQRPKTPVADSYEQKRVQIRLQDDSVVNALIQRNKEGELVGLLSSGRVVEIETGPNGTIVEYIPFIETAKEDLINERFQSLFARDNLFANENIDTSGIERLLSGVNSYAPDSSALPNLPSIDLSRATTDEFKRFLDRLVRQAVRVRESNLQGIDFSDSLKGIRLQSIVTSPIKYAIIDGKRYGVGDLFFVPVSVDIQDNQDIEKIINSYLPPQGSMPDDTYNQFVALSRQAIQQYESLISGENQPRSNARSHKLGVTIKDIMHRQVIVTVNGKDYPLKVRFAL